MNPYFMAVGDVHAKCTDGITLFTGPRPLPFDDLQEGDGEKGSAAFAALAASARQPEYHFSEYATCADGFAVCGMQLWGWDDKMTSIQARTCADSI